MGGIGTMGLFRRSGRLVILLAVLLAGQASAEAPPTLRLSPEIPREGQTFELFFLAPGTGAETFAVDGPPQFPDGIALLSGPSIFPVSEKDPATGNVGRFVKVLYRFRAVRAGRSVMGPIPFSLGERKSATEPAVLEIARKTGSLLAPFDLEWRVPSTEILLGQTVPVYLDMVNLPVIAVPESVAVTPPGGGVFEDAEGLGTIGSVSAGGKELYRVTAASYLLTPSSPGTLILRPATVRAQGMTVESPRLTLNVAELPAGARPTGAVGGFRVSSRVDPTQPLLGDAVTLVVRVEGEGNLNYLQLPPLQFPDFAVLGQTQHSTLIPGKSGYSGAVEWEIRLSPKKTGTLPIDVPAFPWFDPQAGEVRSWPGRTHRVLVREAAGAAEPKDTERLRPLRGGDAAAREPWDAYRRGVAYLLLLPGPALFIHRILRKRRKTLPILLVLLSAPGMLPGGPDPGPGKPVSGGEAAAPDKTAPLRAGEPAAKGVTPRAGSPARAGEPARRDEEARSDGLLFMDQGVEAYWKGDFSDAVEFFSRAAQGMPDSPGVHYNLGISHAALADVPRAVFHLRRAVVIRPGNLMFRAALIRVEGESGLSRQYGTPRFHPDLFFFALVITGNLTFAAPGVFRKRSAGFILGGSLLVLAALSLAGLGYTAAERDSPWGVVSVDGAELRKIPLPSSSEWLRLPAGATVRIRGESGGYVLARTGFDVEGWLAAGDVLRSPEKRRGG